MKLILFNVRYSPNLGDGLLSECLEMELRGTPQQPRVASIDLAGRTCYGPGTQRRRIALMVLERFPLPVRQLVASSVLAMLLRRLKRSWRIALADADGVIVGGGNLFADADLNFPMKINGALAAAHGVPLAVFSVGVTANWSRRGKHLFLSALRRARLVDATVRDERSQQVWNDNLVAAGILPAGIARDPGLLTASHFPAAVRAQGEPHIGLGLTDPIALRYHSVGRTIPAALDQWLAALVQSLVAQGCRVTLFTNGSPEDRSYLTRIGVRLAAIAPKRVAIAAGFERPADLAAFISGCDAVLSHRMHACIAAYSYGIPAIGFAWDKKMDSFFALTGYSARLIDPAVIGASDAAKLTSQCLKEGVEPGRRDQLVSESRLSVARIAALFADAKRQR